MLHNLWKDESGAVISAELALVLTIAVLAMIVGLSELAVAVSSELNDASNAIGHLNQSFSVVGYCSFKDNSFQFKNVTSNMAFFDGEDDCDSNNSCSLVCGAPARTEVGQ